MSENKYGGYSPEGEEKDLIPPDNDGTGEVEKIIQAKKTKIIVMCGSSKFCQIMAVAAWILEKKELAITMGLHLLPDWYFTEPVLDHLAEHEGVARSMDELHMRKIDLCDEIFVINYNDYIGKSTMNEILYAQKLGKGIRWYTHDQIGKNIDELIKRSSSQNKKRGNNGKK